ncbi:MAG: tRNA lysidine(34) synthetase TilS [Thermodesulfobacteriota bacterium]
MPEVDDILKTVTETVRAHAMLKRGDVVLAAVSGGADSVVMLRMLCALMASLDLRVVVFHLNHNLRGPEAARDAAFVRRQAKRLGLAYEGRKLRAGELGDGSPQEAAREARYRHLLDAAAKHGAARIALGHTLDDQAETVLLRLIKGTGGGISGIPPKRGPFIRPLIEVSRADIEAYAAANRLSYVTDSTNLTTKYLRNDIRLNLIPYLKERYNPNIAASLARLSSILRADSEFLDAGAEAAFADVAVSKGRCSVVLDRARLARLHAAIKARVIMKSVWFLTGESDIYSAHIMASIKAVESRRPNVSVDLPGGVRLVREYDRVVITTAPASTPRAYDVALKAPGTTVIKEAGYTFKAGVLRKRPATLAPGARAAYFDADAFAGGGIYHFRPMEPGDRMVPLGMKGSKKLKEIFIERKVPRSERSTIPLLCSGDTVVWAVGVRQSETLKVGPRTKRILRIEFKRPLPPSDFV